MPAWVWHGVRNFFKCCIFPVPSRPSRSPRKHHHPRQSTAVMRRTQVPRRRPLRPLLGHASNHKWPIVSPVSLPQRTPALIMPATATLMYLPQQTPSQQKPSLHLLPFTAVPATAAADARAANPAAAIAAAVIASTTSVAATATVTAATVLSTCPLAVFCVTVVLHGGCDNHAHSEVRCCHNVPGSVLGDGMRELWTIEELLPQANCALHEGWWWLQKLPSCGRS